MNERTSPKPWGGRFAEATDAFVEAFTASVGFDRRLYAEDIAGSIAHARMLARQGILSDHECQAIIAGLERIRAAIEAGTFVWSVPLEDVHMNIEAALIADIGDAGKRLHTARSRNDQVATDLRLWLRGAIDELGAAIARVQDTLLTIAEREVNTIMPGFTHLQVAQPIVFGHHMMAWYEMLARDAERLSDCRRRVNVLPLGAAALAGTGYPLDRAYVAEQLGFERLCENSLDAVADRDFAVEFCAAAAILAMHLSRCCEEIILWASAQFGFIELADAFCTGSSIMPQKKNPDVAELIRGKSGRIFGHLMALLTVMKAQPLAYNKDNQEDKEPLFDTVDTLLAALRAFDGMLGALRCDRARMRAAARQGFATATDLADYLVRKGLPFRDAHAIVGQAVALASRKGCALDELSLAELRQLSPAISEDAFAVLSLEGAVHARNLYGGTAPAQVRAAIARARARRHPHTPLPAERGDVRDASVGTP